MERAAQDFTFTSEAGTWLRMLQPRPDLNGTPATELLALADHLPGNLRYAIRDAGVFLLGEIRSPDVEYSPDATRSRLRGFLGGERRAAPWDADLVETVLGSSGLDWSRRETTWVVPPSSGCPRELRVAIEDRAVRVEAVLASWTTIGEAAREALATFLCRSHAGLRFARAELDANSARVVSRVEEPELLDGELPDSLGSVAAACHLLAREAQALLGEDLARTYLETWAVRRPAAVKKNR